MIAKASFDFANSRVIDLTPDVAMLPITSQLFDSMSEEAPPGKFFDSFHYLRHPLAAACSSLSQFGIIAYMEAEFFGGREQQAMIAWRDQQITIGPLGDADAINKALKLFGIKRGRGGSEFDAVNLGRHRETAEWLSEEN